MLSNSHSYRSCSCNLVKISRSYQTWINQFPIRTFIITPNRYPFKNKKNIPSIASIWRENMHRYLSADVLCSEMRTAIRERSLRKLWVWRNRYSSTFLRQKEALFRLLSFRYFATREWNFLLPVVRLLFSALWYNFMNKQTSSFSVTITRRSLILNWL